MFRKLLLPALAATLLAGCVTDYTYRGAGGRGDYYYGRPSVEYRYQGGYGGYYGYPYGYGGYWGSPYRPGYWGYPYRHGYWGYPYYGPRYPYYRYDRHPGPRPGRPYSNDGGSKGPWTGADDLRRRIEQSQRMQPGTGPANAPRPTMSQPPRAMTPPRAYGPRPQQAPRPRMMNPNRVQERER